MNLTTRKILIVDDDHSMVDTMVGIFEELDFDMLYVPNSFEAAEVAENERPDLIILDWQMPILSGLDVMKQLNENEETSTIPIIIISGYMTLPKDLECSLDAGAVDYLRKPLNSFELRARVRAALRSKDQNELLFDMIKSDRDQLKEHLKLQELAFRNQSIYDMQKDELLLKMIDQVERLDEITKKSYQTDLRPIRKELKSLLDLKENWKQVNDHFDKVHPEFFERIKHKNEKLTTYDLKLCAYLKMGLDNTEIANLMHIARKSVETALNRLRKKLHLNEQESLREYVFKV